MFSLFLKKSAVIITLSLLWLSSLMLSSCTNAEQAVQLTKNITYNDQNQRLDLYIPKIRDKKTAIMFIHGGGFKYGSKEDMASFASLYAQDGFVTTSINYRLTPKHTYPAAINDVKGALIWMKNNAEKYGYNPSKLVVIGYSAGATLALNLGLDHTQEVAAAISVAPVTDIGILIKSAPYLQLRSELASYMGGEPPIKASPIAQVNAESSPVLLFHGDKDIIVPISQSVLLAKKLKAHNVPVLMRVFPDAGHEIMFANKYLKQLLKEMTKFILSVETKQ